MKHHLQVALFIAGLAIEGLRARARRTPLRFP